MKTLALAFALTALCLAQAARKANEAYQTPQSRASIAAGLSDPARDARQKPKELLAALDLRPGMTVVDLGTGPGYMLPFLSAAVGPSGRVIAEDIQSDFLAKARAKASSESLKNVNFVLGTETDPKLPRASADVILVLDAYHHFDYPERMLASLKSALKPDGRLAIVEYHKLRGAMGEGDPDRPLKHIRATAEEVVKEAESNGFKLLWRRDHIPNSQYIAMFESR
jgi:ubiquinone/menaquinone biosynthesis C-methylase UbiE